MDHEKAKHEFRILSLDETHGESGPGSQVRSYLRYKRIPHEWLVRNSAERMQEQGFVHVLIERQPQMSSVQNPCWLMIIVDYTTQYIGDCSNPIAESL